MNKHGIGITDASPPQTVVPNLKFKAIREVRG
jgi:hypothetical protein